MPSQRYNQTPPSFRQRSRRRMMREQDSSPRARFFARPVVRQTKPRRVASVRRTQDIAEDSSPLPLPLARASETRNSSTVSQKYRRESGQFCPATTVVLLILLGDEDHQHSESRAEIRLHAPLVSRSPGAQDSAAHCESVAGVHDTIPKPTLDCLRMLPASPVSPDPDFANNHPSHEKSGIPLSAETPAPVITRIQPDIGRRRKTRKD